jgi:hypothetical protein
MQHRICVATGFDPPTVLGGSGCRFAAGSGVRWSKPFRRASIPELVLAWCVAGLGLGATVLLAEPPCAAQGWISACRKLVYIHLHTRAKSEKYTKILKLDQGIEICVPVKHQSWGDVSMQGKQVFLSISSLRFPVLIPSSILLLFFGDGLPSTSKTARI